MFIGIIFTPSDTVAFKMHSKIFYYTKFSLSSFLMHVIFEKEYFSFAKIRFW